MPLFLKPEKRFLEPDPFVEGLCRYVNFARVLMSTRKEGRLETITARTVLEMSPMLRML